MEVHEAGSYPRSGIKRSNACQQPENHAACSPGLCQHILDFVQNQLHGSASDEWHRIPIAAKDSRAQSTRPGKYCLGGGELAAQKLTCRVGLGFGGLPLTVLGDATPEVR